QYYGRSYTLETLRHKSGINREGVSLLGISEAAEQIGFRTTGVRLTWKQLQKEAPLPCVAYWNQVHFVVIYKTTKQKVFVADPAKGKITYTKSEFLQQWSSDRENNQHTGIVLLLRTTPSFYDFEGEGGKGLDFSRLLSYLMPYKNLLFQL